MPMKGANLGASSESMPKGSLLLQYQVDRWDAASVR